MALAAAVLAPAPAHAGSLDIEAWLDRPGVRLVAVELYASWCAPCVAAVPRWKALHDRYRDAGLRLVVIVTQDPKGGLVNPGWTPDETIRDDDGTIADALGAQGELPSAYLWSWQGELLARQGQVGDVEAAIEAWMAGAQRVAVQGAPGGEPLVRLVEAEVARSGKLDVIADPEARAAVRRAYARRLAARPADEVARCEAGGRLTERSVLTARVIDAAGAPRLQLALLSVERGCMVEHAVAPWRADRQEASVAEAVATITRALRRQLAVPRQATSSRAEVTPFPGDDGSRIVNPPVDDTGFLLVTSEPSRAEVTLNGERVGATPFQAELMAGDYVVVCNKSALYASGRQRIRLSRKGAKVHMSLAPQYGVLEVTSDPPGAAISVDDEPTGEVAPHTFPPKRAGVYQVSGSLPLHVPARAEVTLADGALTEVLLKLAPNHGALLVRSEPPGLPVSIDGAEAQLQTPARVARLAAGLHRVEVRSPGHLPQEAYVTVEAGEQAELSFAMKPRTGLLKATATRLRDGETEPVAAAVWIDGARRTETTPFKATLPIGEHRVEIRGPGGQAHAEAITIAEGRVATVQARLAPSASSVAAPPAVTAAPSASSVAAPPAVTAAPPESSAAGGWIAGLGGAVLAGGVLATVLGQTTLEQDAQRAGSSEALDRAAAIMDGATTGGVVAMAAGGALVVVGLVVLSWGEGEGAVARVHPGPDGGARVSIGGRF